jgi:hypothetical protein
MREATPVASGRKSTDSNLISLGQLNNTGNLVGRDFARVLGEKPTVGHVCAELHGEIDAFIGAYGPPEKIGGMLYWNFSRSDGALGFTAHTHIHPENGLSLRVCAHRDAAEFFGWISDSLSAVSNCERPPAFIGAEGMSIRAERF